VGEKFVVRFDGPGVEDHTIDAALFGESLLALSELIHDARDVIYPDGPYFRVRVEDVGDGSFLVGLELTELWDAVAKLFADQDAQAVMFLLALFGRDGLLGFLLWLRGKRPIIERQPDGLLKAHVEDRETVIETRVGQLYASTKVRRSVRKLTGSIKTEDIEALTIAVPHSEPIQIDSTNRGYFSAPADDEKVTDQTTTVWLRIAIVRAESRHWSFRDMTGQLIPVTVLDDAFWTRFQEGLEPIRPHDSLMVRLQVEQWDRDGVLDTEYSILEVLEHRTGDTGIQMMITPPNSDTPQLPKNTTE
jgi:hypothetical protein